MKQSALAQKISSIKKDIVEFKANNYYGSSSAVVYELPQVTISGNLDIPIQSARMWGKSFKISIKSELKNATGLIQWRVVSGTLNGRDISGMTNWAVDGSGWGYVVVSGLIPGRPATEELSDPLATFGSIMLASPSDLNQPAFNIVIQAKSTVNGALSVEVV